MGWGHMIRTKMKQDIDMAMKVRRARRMYYNIKEDISENILWFVCIFGGVFLATAVWYGFDYLMEVWR